VSGIAPSAPNAPVQDDWPPRLLGPRVRTALLIALYLALGLVSLAIVGLTAWMADPCGPSCVSASGSSYDELQGAVLGLGGVLYVGASVPLAILRSRGIVWLVPILAFLVVTVGGVALLVTAAEGGLCECGF
jgi:hypothetical protein